VRPEDIRAYLRRDWEAVARLKARFWVEDQERRGPLEALKIADGLRCHVAGIRPEWPSVEEREADLAVHIRVSESLRRVARTGLD